MATYQLTDEALDDLDRLYEHGVLTFGLSQADAYYDDLVLHFQEIAGHPEHHVAVDEIRAGYRRSVFGSHSIYFKQIGADVLIVRILGAQDADRALAGK